MKNRFSAFAILYFALVVFNACKQPVSQLALYVPKDASAVFVVDGKAITDKIASSGITIDSLANLFSEGKNENAVHWDDIKNSGIDLNKPVYIFSKGTYSMQQGSVNSGGLIAEVQDEKKVEAFFKKQKPGSNVASAEKYKYIQLHKDVVAGWTDKVLIISTAYGNDSAGKEPLAQSQLTTLFAQKESASIASLDAFKGTFSKTGDIHFYTNTAAKLNEFAMPGMDKINALLKDSYTEGSINFEKGKIDAVGETHYNKTLSDIINKYPVQDINMDIIKNYPDTLTAFGIISFNPKVLVDILHYLGFDVMADGFASSIGFTTNDVLSALSGDIAIMFSSHPGKTMENSIKSGGFLLVVPVGDKTAFDKVMAGLLNKEILSKNGDQYRLGRAGGHGFVIETGNNNLFIASGDTLIKAYQAPANKQSLPADVEKYLGNKTMAVYFDINNFLQNKRIENSSSVNIHLHDSDHNDNIEKSAKETFKNFIAFADKGDDKTIASTYRLNFVNDTENSLASLVKFIVVAHQEEMKNKHWTAHPPLSGLHDTDNLKPEKDTAIAQ